MTTKTLSHNEIFQAIEEDSQAEIIIEQLEELNEEPFFVISFAYDYYEEETSLIMNVYPLRDYANPGCTELHSGWIKTEQAIQKHIKEAREKDIDVFIYGEAQCVEWMYGTLEK